MPDLPPRFLIGGGRNDEALRPLYAQFLAACPGPRPRVGCLLIDEGDGETDAQLDRFAGALAGAGRCHPQRMAVPLGTTWDPAALDGLDGLLVCAGRTPAYRAALAPASATVQSWMATGGRPYAGFSAGSAIAAAQALVGGFQLAGRAVCPEDAGEDLDPVTVEAGLALTSLTIDVHCAQWGTLSRLVAATEAGLVERGVALDENTMLVLDAAGATVHGVGNAWLVSRSPGGAAVHRSAAGDRLPG